MSLFDEAIQRLLKGHNVVCEHPLGAIGGGRQPRRRRSSPPANEASISISETPDSVYQWRELLEANAHRTNDALLSEVAGTSV